MSDGNKLQPHTYSLKSAGLEEDPVCGYRLYCQIVPPQDALTIENLRTHLIIQFYTGSPGIPVGLRKIVKVGITNTIIGSQLVTYDRFYDVNIEADGNKIVEVDIDLTALLKKDNVEFWGADVPTNGTFVYIEFPIEILNYSKFFDFGSGPVDTLNIGELFLWKIDALFTTEGIR